MRWWRYKLGVWLLRPALISEWQIAQAAHKQQIDGPLERYWMARQTAIHRILFGQAWYQLKRNP